MKDRNFFCLRMLTVAFVVLLAWPSLAGAQSVPRLTPLPLHRGVAGRALATLPADPSSPWQAVTNVPVYLDQAVCYTAANPLLLTDGTVMVQNGGCQDWWKLTPDNTGSYVNGTWTELASLPPEYSPLYHSSAVLPDGRVIIEGGEYNFFNAVWTNLGAIYDPIANTWTPVTPPASWSTIGDAQSVVLANGTYMQANCCTTQQALLNPTTLTWTPTGTGKFDDNDEEGWTLLPNMHVLTVDAYVPITIPYEPTGMNSELYNPRTGSWSSAGSTVVQLWDSWLDCGELSQEPLNGPSFELGPAVLRPDGTVFYTGSDTCPSSTSPTGFASGHTAIYNSFTEKWKPGPDFPGGVNIADGPASLEINGKVLMMASPGFGNIFPSTFFEWDGENLTEVPGTPHASGDASFYGNMLVLPTGQILLTDFSTDIEIYTSTGTYNPLLAPLVLFAPEKVTPGGSYVTFGFLYNGMSQGAAYGDDVQAATNYPLVRITNKATGHVFYSRTHDHSSMGVGLFTGLVSTHFDVPATQEKGLSELVVVANGIPSRPITVNVR